MRVNEINGMAISDTSDFEQDERSFQPLIYLEIVLIQSKVEDRFIFPLSIIPIVWPSIIDIIDCLAKDNRLYRL